MPLDLQLIAIAAELLPGDVIAIHHKHSDPDQFLEGMFVGCAVQHDDYYNDSINNLVSNRSADYQIKVSRDTTSNMTSGCGASYLNSKVKIIERDSDVADRPYDAYRLCLDEAEKSDIAAMTSMFGRESTLGRSRRPFVDPATGNELAFIGWAHDEPQFGGVAYALFDFISFYDDGYPLIWTLPDILEDERYEEIVADEYNPSDYIDRPVLVDLRHWEQHRMFARHPKFFRDSQRENFIGVLIPACLCRDLMTRGDFESAREKTSRNIKTPPWAILGTKYLSMNKEIIWKVVCSEFECPLPTMTDCRPDRIVTLAIDNGSEEDFLSQGWDWSAQTGLFSLGNAEYWSTEFAETRKFDDGRWGIRVRNEVRGGRIVDKQIVICSDGYSIAQYDSVLRNFDEWDIESLQLPKPKSTSKGGVLYRAFLEDNKGNPGELQYIGITDRGLVQRIKEHYKSKTLPTLLWKTESYPNREALMAAEKHAIQTEHPPLNVIYNGMSRNSK